MDAGVSGLLLSTDRHERPFQAVSSVMIIASDIVA